VGDIADAPPPIAKDIPAAPNAGKAIFRRFRFEPCFARAIEPSYNWGKSRMLDDKWGRVDFVAPGRDLSGRAVFFT
jgi:hypothetical protein